MLSTVPTADARAVTARRLTFLRPSTLGFEREMSVPKDLHVMTFAVAFGIGQTVAVFNEAITTHQS
jgi:hypothetical protein